MAIYKKDYVNVGVKPTTKNQLTMLAKYGDSMDDVITRLIMEHKQHLEDAQ